MINDYVSRHDPDAVRLWHNTGAWGDECVHDLLKRYAIEKSESLALTDGQWRLTFAELWRAVEEARSALTAIGVGQRSVVAVDFVSALFTPLHAAASSLGAVTLSVPPAMDEGRLVRLMENGDVDQLLTSQVRARNLGASRQPFGIQAVEPRSVGGGAFVPEFREVARAPDVVGQGHAAGDWGADDIYHIVPTSGTTGFPRLALRTHNSWLAMARKKVAYLRGGIELGGDDRLLVMTPISYGLGYFHGYVISAHLGGATFLLPKVDPADALRLIKEEGITVLVGVPAQVIRMLEVLRERENGPLGAKVLLVGGDHLDRHAAMEFEDRTGVLVALQYGLVDAGLAAATPLTGTQEERFASAGRPLDWTAVRLVHASGDAPGEGEIAIKAPDGIAGYYPVDDATSITDDGFALSGDIGRIDKDGSLHIVGRRKDIIIRGGLNISASEVEKFLTAVPGVRMAAAVGVADPTLGERVCAVIELEDSSLDVTLDDVLAAARAAGVAKKYWPEHLLLLDCLPVTDNGKVDKKRIRQLVAATAGPRAPSAEL